MKLHLVAGNQQKFEIAKFALESHGIEVERLDIQTPEIQAFETEEVVKYSVKYAAEKFNKPVIKDDVGMVIDTLNGFPGPFVKFINGWLSAEQFSSLYRNIPKPKAYFIDSLGYCRPGEDPVCFSTKTFGRILDLPRGNNGNMVDSLFLPDGYDKTIAELNKEEILNLWANNRFDQLANYLKINNK